MCHPLSPLSRGFRLFQRGVDAGEVGIQRGAETVDCRDNGKRDPGRDQAVFNRGRAGLIRPKSQKNVPQSPPPCEQEMPHAGISIATSARARRSTVLSLRLH
jgi:hypothetical protein